MTHSNTGLFPTDDEYYQVIETNFLLGQYLSAHKSKGASKTNLVDASLVQL